MSHFRSKKRADFRIITRILELSHGVSNPSTKLLSKITETYSDYGTWCGFFQSDPEQIKLLKRVVKEVLQDEQDEQDKRDK